MTNLHTVLVMLALVCAVLSFFGVPLAVSVVLLCVDLLTR